MGMDADSEQRCAAYCILRSTASPRIVQTCGASCLGTAISALQQRVGERCIELCDPKRSTSKNTTARAEARDSIGYLIEIVYNCRRRHRALGWFGRQSPKRHSKPPSERTHRLTPCLAEDLTTGLRSVHNFEHVIGRAKLICNDLGTAFTDGWSLLPEPSTFRPYRTWWELF
jgi:hypothetical protein